MIALGFNDTSTLAGPLCHLPEKGRREIEEIVEEMKESDRGERGKMNESEEKEELKTSPLYPYLLQGQQALPNCKPLSVGRPGDAKYTTPLPHPTTPPPFFFSSENRVGYNMDVMQQTAYLVFNPIMVDSLAFLFLFA